MINSDPNPRDGNSGLSASLTSWTPAQKSVLIASLLGWTFDAFDFFLMVFVLKAIAAEFATPLTFANVLTLAMRPVGACLFGRAARLDIVRSQKAVWGGEKPRGRQIFQIRRSCAVTERKLQMR